MSNTNSLGAGSPLGAIVVAAGSSTRMGGIDKTFAPLLGIPLLAHSLRHLELFPPVKQIALVLPASSLPSGEELILQQGFKKVTSLCPGGARRQDSVKNGLESLLACDWVVVHDGARPGLDQALLQRGWQAAQETGAAIAGVPVKDTIKITDQQGMVVKTPPRARLWAGQTPQFFRYDWLRQAHSQLEENFTDDAAMVERMGHPVRVFMGSYRNLKVTTPEDLIIAEALLSDDDAKVPIP